MIKISLSSSIASIPGLRHRQRRAQEPRTKFDSKGIPEVVKSASTSLEQSGVMKHPLQSRRLLHSKFGITTVEIQEYEREKLYAGNLLGYALTGFRTLENRQS